MNVTNIAEETYQLSINLENILFEGLWEIPNGASINSYIIKGEKTAIVDGVCSWNGAPESLFSALNEVGVSPESIEYLIVNHMEPDHSGWIESFKKLNSKVKIVCSSKAKDLLGAFCGITENIICVKHGDTLDLGNGHILIFAEIPNVHWPDTIATFDASTGILFSCDAFGSFGKITSSKYADDLSNEELKAYENDTIRYYSNIVATFSMQVKNAISKCKALPIKMIAPSHGLMWRNTDKIIEAYSNYASYQNGPARQEITLIWGSMYGMTEKAVKHVIGILEKEDIIVHVHQVPQDSWGTVLTSAWTSTGIILAMPTYEYKMFPPMASVLEELGKKKVCNRKVFRFGSYGWSGGAQRELDDINSRLNMHWEFLEPVEFKGNPSSEEIELISKRVQDLIKEVKDIGEKPC